MQAVQIGEAADVSVADENLRDAALAGTALHLCKIFGIAVDADFIYFAYAQGGEQLFGHRAIGAGRACIHGYGLHGYFLFSFSALYGHTVDFTRPPAGVSDKPFFQTALSADCS